MAYLPLLLTRPGWVSADTKTYLYLDPGSLLGGAWSMWDPSVGMGTVTHQNIGFLWPMGPFFWLGDAVGLPDWVTQRLWWGSIIFIAGAGVAHLLRTLGWRGPGIAAASFTYALSPYLLTLVSRLSAILLPFAALPWLLAFAVQSVRHRGWRYPALFALTAATFGSVNATALLLVGLAPALWLVHAVWGAREASLRAALRAGTQMGLLTVLVSAWWIAGLSVQSTHGLNVLRYSETAEVVASASTSHEVLRSLGYWFFYGGDRLGPWIEASKPYTQWLPVIALSFLLPVLGLAGAAVARWRHRAYFVLLLLLVGTILAVGAYPWDEGPLLGRAFQAFFATDAGLAMRSLPRAVPLVAFSLAVLLGSGVATVTRRWPRLERPLAPVVPVVAVLALPPLWLGQFVPDNLKRHEDLPAYWHEAADHLDANDDDTRVLEIPGTDFASYRWGNTVDPVLSGLMERPSVARELIPFGSPASANLLNALDLPLQERTAQADAIGPIARLMRAGHVLVRSDLQYERFNTPRPRNLWDLITDGDGLGEPEEFGPGEPNETIPDVQLFDELFFATDPTLPDPPEVGVFPVDDPLPIVTTHAVTRPLLVAGDGAGLVEAAGAGLIDGTELIRYSATLNPEEIAAALDNEAALLVTDSNRKRGERWTHVRHTRGATETLDGEMLEEDLRDNRLPVFPDAGADAQTVTVNRSGIEATATAYGNPVTYTPEDRPAFAVDGDPRTAWRTAAFTDARGERLELTLSEPVTTDHVTLSQPTAGLVTRYITEVRLRFDGEDPIDATLAEMSRTPIGQRITFPERSFETLSIEIRADTAGDIPRFAAESSVGFNMVEIGDDMPLIEEAVRLPTDLLDAAGADSLDHPLAISLKRLRQDPTDISREDEEPRLVRLLRLPTERSFALGGEARLSARAEAYTIDDLLERPHDGSVPWARASTQLNGAVTTPSAAFDGDPTTAWTTARAAPINQWVEVVLPEATTIDSLPLTVVADGHHSVPTEIELWVDGVPEARVPVPAIADVPERSATAEVELDIPEVTGSRFRVKLTGVREMLTNDWITDNEVPQPAAIADVRLPGHGVPDLDPTFDSGCREDLLEIDGQPVPLRITGPMDDALAAKPLQLQTCDDAEVTLEGGEHEIRSARGRDTGVDLDHIVLRSAPGGGATSNEGVTLVTETRAGDDGDPPPATTDEAPSVEILDEGRDQMRLQISDATPDTPFWLVLGQSYNSGWTAEGATHPEPRLVNGFANGWLVIPTQESFQVDLEFAPQQRVNWALWLSLIAGLGALLLLIRRPRRVIAAPSAMPEPYSSVLAFRYHGALPTRPVAWVAGIAVGIGAWLVAGPIVGPIVGVAAGVAARHETFRRWVLLAAPAALAVAATYVVYVQMRHAPEATFDWPMELRRPHPLGWLAVWLMAADVIVGRIWQSRSSELED